MKIAAKNDKAHLGKMAEMKQLMSKAGAMEEWMNKKKEEFDAVSEK